MKNIYVPLDLKSNNQDLIDQATAIAKAFGATVWIEHVATPDPEFAGYAAGPQYIRDMRADELKEEHHALMRIANDLISMGIKTHALLIHGTTTDTILNEAERLHADLIVMGSHGRRGLAKAFMGSVCDEVLGANRFRVLVVPTPQEH